MRFVLLVLFRFVSLFLAIHWKNLLDLLCHHGITFHHNFMTRSRWTFNIIVLLLWFPWSCRQKHLCTMFQFSSFSIMILIRFPTLMLCPSVIFIEFPGKLNGPKYCMLGIISLISAAGAMNRFYFVNFNEVVISLRCKQSKNHFNV